MNKNKSFIICLLIFLSKNSFTASGNFEQTTRMQSSAGVGVGAVLLDEATMLNPAPMAFYQIGAIYYQQEKSSSDVSNIKDEGKLIIASDSKGPVGGSISYRSTESGEDINVSLATPVSDKSAIGITYRNYRPIDGEDKTSFDIGVSHAVTEFFTFGAVLKNPERVSEIDTRLIVGTQFVYEEFISLMVDFGTDWKEDLSGDLLYGGAIQFKTFSDIFLRLGSSRDKKLNTSQSGIGLSWVTPKIIVSLSASNVEEISSQIKYQNSSFAISYKF